MSMQDGKTQQYGEQKDKTSNSARLDWLGGTEGGTSDQRILEDHCPKEDNGCHSQCLSILAYLDSLRAANKSIIGWIWDNRL
jgi:hypothetical protein